MATYTSNLSLKKPAQSDKIRIADLNGNADNIDAAIGADFGQSSKPSINAAINSLADGLAIVAQGDVHAAISAGQFVYVRNHSTLAEGLYVASAAISANAALSGTNLTADTSGGLNALNNNLTNFTKDYGATGGFTAGAKFTVDSSRVQIFGTQAYITVVATANQAYGNTDVIATIPENYRPIRASTSMLSILIRGSSVLTFTGQDIIGTDGTIKEGFTGSNGQAADKYTIVAIYQVKS